MLPTNLNEYIPESDGSFDSTFADNSIHEPNVDVSVFFRNQKKALLQKISEYNCIFGCVAWLTDFDIIKALSKVEQVSIVVQKEDFLRPDTGSSFDWKNNLRKAYSELNNDSERFFYPGLMGNLSFKSDPTVSPIRCVGV